MAGRRKRAAVRQADHKKRVHHAGRVIPVTGNCFEECAEYVLHAAMLGRKFDWDDVRKKYTSSGGRDLVLVHGEVLGRGPLEGVQFAHAWVEDGDEVIDVTRNVRMPRDQYYALGAIDQIGNMHRYTVDQIRRHGAETGHWGPWELVTSTGL